MDPNNQKEESFRDGLMRIYGILNFTPDEVKNAINDLAQIQQLRIMEELLKDMTAAEAAELSVLVSKSEEEKRVIIENIAKKHGTNEDFKTRVQAEAKKVQDDHVAYLKTRGDEKQKVEIAKIAAEIGA